MTAVIGSTGGSIRGTSDGSTGELLFRALVQPPLADPPETKLRRFIVSRGLRPGDRLPGEHDLATAVGGTRVAVCGYPTAVEAGPGVLYVAYYAEESEGVTHVLGARVRL